MASENNPTLRRRELGSLLRRMRTERGLTVEDVTQRAMFSATKLSRLETGRVGASPRDIRDLCIVYGVTDAQERDHLMTLAREGKERAWWQRYDLKYETFVALENEAVSIRDYHTSHVPGLLQVEGYIRAIFTQNAYPVLDDATVEQRTEARLRRQAVLARDSAPVLECILDEGALRRSVGGSAVMRTQLARLIEAAQSPILTFQVIPFRVGAHRGMDSNFSILEFENSLVSDVVYVEGLLGNIYLEGASDLERYKRIFAQLKGIALDQEASIAMMADIMETYVGL